MNDIYISKQFDFGELNAKDPFRQRFSTALYAPNTRIEFDHTLVQRLENDHAGLIALIKATAGNAGGGNNARLLKCLNEFRKLFNAHILTEYTKLYIFLDYVYRPSPNIHSVVLDFRREMTRIGRDVRAFCKKWLEQGVTDLSLERFLAELHPIGEVLTHRIEIEENRLYKIYAATPRFLQNLQEQETAAG